MGVNVYPVQPQQVTFGGVQQPVQVANTVNVYQTNWGTTADSSGRIALNGDTSPKLIHQTTAGQALVIHSVTISQHYTSGSAGDRLGISVYHHSDASSTQQGKVFASNFFDKGTITISFPNGGLKLPAGQNLYYFVDNYGAYTINGRVDVIYSEVTP